MKYVLKMLENYLTRLKLDRDSYMHDIIELEMKIHDTQNRAERYIYHSQWYKAKSDLHATNQEIERCEKEIERCKQEIERCIKVLQMIKDEMKGE